jgi:peptidoglycan/xylan/chitin deacetylase (PgdA/CDA1 family)
MRAATTIAKAATRVTWPLTRQDRNGDPSGPVVLCYHRVLPRSANSQLPRYTVTPQQFHEQMTLLAAEGFRSLTLDDFRAAASGARELPPRSVLVTFDDGFADIYLNAWPIARESHITLNIFLCTGLITGERVEGLDRSEPAGGAKRRDSGELDRPLTWKQIYEMSQAGVGFGFHSHTHRNHGRLSLAEITEDARRGLAVLQNQIGIKPAAFAFPYGHHGSHTSEAISVLRQQGLEIFFSTEMDRTPLPSSASISRFVIHHDDDIQSFRRKLYGGYDWVGKLRRFGYSMSASFRREVDASSQA